MDAPSLPAPVVGDVAKANAELGTQYLTGVAAAPWGTGVFTAGCGTVVCLLAEAIALTLRPPRTSRL
ncbi:hypothetical protein AB0I10_00940 [Streptomyces sp. NPDC050636]|uniref:hypothetical protein n=1 Tax=Streptomyces sp. NPDC050636 TaxID=3154510 RepID=UPI0034248FB9